MQQALIETNLAQQPHRLTLDSRSRLSITGVLEVESFDDTEILLTSTRGPMSIRGQGLHLQQLSIDGGQVLVDGSVDAISYEDDIPRGGFSPACSADGDPCLGAGADLCAGGAAGARAVSGIRSAAGAAAASAAGGNCGGRAVRAAACGVVSVLRAHGGTGAVPAVCVPRRISDRRFVFPDAQPARAALVPGALGPAGADAAGAARAAALFFEISQKNFKNPLCKLSKMGYNDL